jgi:DNA-binding CsgD family transcriptional regulator
MPRSRRSPRTRQRRVFPPAAFDTYLTDSELTVVNLIADGATNRSVAQQLHLSPHTVKTHLHNAFAKLGITSRAQLTPLMRRPD